MRTRHMPVPFSILAVGSFPQTATLLGRFPVGEKLSVSSLLDRFLRHIEALGVEVLGALSVSSLLDRFLRHHHTRRALGAGGTFSILAVGSFPQTPIMKMQFRF